ncbi:MAG: alpha/beta fold hydrolase [Ectothiorhodospiraceae bacterium]|nr:alpha/beta fold hydrolase [Chromatiales bacterium]MCP5154057.1 alpha/beta fold hydrolase [Ectothiorhodospiraceae bacterium]
MPIHREDHWLDSTFPGTRMLLRSKHDGTPRGTPVLFVHGATYGASMTYDYPVAGRSWMEAMAADGFDAWGLDLPGYGESERPPAMDAPASASPPLLRTEEAVACVERAVAHVLARRGTSRLHLIGYSWGTAISGRYAGLHPEHVSRLVLLGATWMRDGPSPITADGPPGAYRVVTAAAAAARWVHGLEPDQAAQINDQSEREAWACAVVARDPVLGRETPPRLRAPAGVVADRLERWGAGEPTYEPADIRAPTLIVVGEWDHETTPAQGRAVFDRLRNAADRRFLLIGRATHSMPLERQHPALRASVAAFLRE